MLQLQRKKWR